MTASGAITRFVSTAMARREIGSAFAPSLIRGLADIESFRRIVLDGRSSGASVMKGFAGDPNVAPYVDDIYAYLQARADGALGRGRPIKLDE